MAGIWRDPDGDVYEVRFFQWEPVDNTSITSRKDKGFKAVQIGDPTRAISINLNTKLDAPATATVEVPMRLSAQAHQQGAYPDQVRPFQCCMAVMRQKPGKAWETLFGGIIWNLRVNLDQETVTVAAGDFMTFYENRKMGRAGRKEQTAIIYDHGVNDANWGINTKRVKTDVTGVQRDFNYNDGYYPAAKTAYDMADNINGFFVWMEAVVKGNVLEHTMRFSAERKPQAKNLGRLVDGYNAVVHEVFVDGTSWARVAYAYGESGEFGKGAPVKRMDNPEKKGNDPWPDHRWPVRDVDQKFSGIKYDSTLEDKARTMLRFGQRATRVPRVTVHSRLSEAVGDTLDIPALDANNGKCVHIDVAKSRFEVNDSYLITETKTTIETDGSAVCELGLIEKSMFQVTGTGNG